jgi:dTDP-4-amino-4,6-dideoxygalactose transaminase
MEWKIPLADLKIGNEEINAVCEVLKSNWLSMGPMTNLFEENFKNLLGCKYAYAVCNATAALHLACEALGLKEGDEVIVPSLTFVASANAITYTGATPVFADVVSTEDLTICPNDIESKITKKTKAILVVHYAGYACHMDEIMKLAQQYGLFVIEDCAHVPGGSYKGTMLGTIGNAGCFSFFSNKNMTTGEGGMVTTNDDELAKKIKLKRSHGMTTLTWDRHKGHAYSYDVVDRGYNYRIDEMSSALGIEQLKKLKDNNLHRKELVKYYQQVLSDLPEITIPFNQYEEEATYHIFPIVLVKTVDRVKFVEYLKEAGIQTSLHYPAIHLFSYYRDVFGTREGVLPNTEYVTKKEVTLPLYPALGEENIDYIGSKIKEFLSNKL